MESEDHQTWSHLRNYSEVTPLRHLVYQGVQPNTMHKEEIRCPKRIPRQNPCVPTTPIGIHAHTIPHTVRSATLLLRSTRILPIDSGRLPETGGSDRSDAAESMYASPLISWL